MIKVGITVSGGSGSTLRKSTDKEEEMRTSKSKTLKFLSQSIKVLEIKV